MQLQSTFFLLTLIKTSRGAKKSLPEKPLGSGPRGCTECEEFTTRTKPHSSYHTWNWKWLAPQTFTRTRDNFLWFPVPLCICEHDGLDTGRIGDHPSVPTSHDPHHGGSIDTAEEATVGVKDLDMFVTAQLLQDAPARMIYCEALRRNLVFPRVERSSTRSSRR